MVSRLVVTLVSSIGAAGAHIAAREAQPKPPPVPVAQMLGQRIMVAFDGTTAPASLLAQVRAGEVGSVILFSANIGTPSQVRALTGSLQAAARAGHQPPLLIATDQEGGEVKRLPAGPPGLSPPQMVASGKTSAAASEGKATGRYMAGLGINMDLAPVLDVPTFPSAFIAQQGRAFSSTASVVARYGTAFALGLQSGGVVATGKHFPGLGSAAVSTDNAFQELHPTARQRSQALVPYESLIKRGLDAVMLTMAGFPAWDPSGASAAFSRKIIGGLLRHHLHFHGVTITDSLAAPTGHTEVQAAVLAARAGADILLNTDSAPGELAALEHAYGHSFGESAAWTSYERIVALKRRLAAAR